MRCIFLLTIIASTTNRQPFAQTRLSPDEQPWFSNIDGKNVRGDGVTYGQRPDDVWKRSNDENPLMHGCTMPDTHGPGRRRRSIFGRITKGMKSLMNYVRTLPEKRWSRVQKPTDIGKVAGLVTKGENTKTVDTASNDVTRGPNAAKANAELSASSCTPQTSPIKNNACNNVTIYGYQRRLKNAEQRRNGNTRPAPNYGGIDYITRQALCKLKAGTHYFDKKTQRMKLLGKLVMTDRDKRLVAEAIQKMEGGTHIYYKMVRKMVKKIPSKFSGRPNDYKRIYLNSRRYNKTSLLG